MNLKLGVNIDHVATLRQVRGTLYPDVVVAARLCEAAGAEGITVHLREDRRHIQEFDVKKLRESVGTVLNLEMACDPGVIKIACDVGPDEVCLVPEKREELTTEGGLDVAGNTSLVKDVVSSVKSVGAMVSLFVDPEKEQLEAAVQVAAPCVELHTGAFCNAFDVGNMDDAEHELQRLKVAAAYANHLSLQVNAGHGINMANIADILRIPFMDTLNIGHSIVSRSVFIGLEQAVKEMLEGMSLYKGGEVQ